ncbi:OmpH family outer membrane protein [bacterium]|nr:MAG: OmpH family outer membrane protein [bacterium]
MRQRLVVVLAIASGILFLNPAFAAEKIGTVDVGKLFDEYKKTQEYDKDLEQKANAYEKDRDAKISDVKQLQDKLGLLADAEKDKKQKELEDKVKSVREFSLTKESELKKERDERLKEVLKDIESAVEEYAKKEGYSMIFNDRVFVYNNKASDITPKVLESLQSGYKKPAAKEGK